MIATFVGNLITGQECAHHSCRGRNAKHETGVLVLTFVSGVSAETVMLAVTVALRYVALCVCFVESHTPWTRLHYGSSPVSTESWYHGDFLG